MEYSLLFTWVYSQHTVLFPDENLRVLLIFVLVDTVNNPS